VIGSTLPRRLPGRVAIAMFALAFPVGALARPHRIDPAGTAAGHPIHLRKELEPDAISVGALRGMGYGHYCQAAGHVCDTSDRFDWFTFGLEDSNRVVIWPENSRLVLETDSGGRWPSSEVLVMSPFPEQKPVALGNARVEIEPGSYWRQPYPKLGVTATVVWAAFPKALRVRVDSVRTLSLEPVAGGGQ
jgi:hypothetical protein